MDAGTGASVSAGERVGAGAGVAAGVGANEYAGEAIEQRFDGVLTRINYS